MKYTYEDILENMKLEYQNAAYRDVGKNSTEEMVLKTLATELFSLSCYGDYILKQAFVQTATGKHLDMLGATRKCERKSGGKASGKLIFAVLDPPDKSILIKKGTICSVENEPLLQYETIRDAILEPGFTEIEVSAQALDYGSKYNVEAETINVMVNAPVSIGAVINFEAFTGGYDGESDEAYRKRIIDAFETPSYYLSRKEIKNRILQCEDIIDCSVPEVRGDNAVTIAVRGKSDSDAQELRSKLSDLVGIDRLLGIGLNVLAATSVGVDIEIAVRSKFRLDQDEIEQSIISFVTDYFSGEKIGESLSIVPIIKYAYGFNDIYNVEIHSESIKFDSISCDWNEYLTLNKVTVRFYE